MRDSVENISLVLEEIEQLINEQLQLIKQGDDSKIHGLAIKAENLMQQVKNSGILGQENFQLQRERLAKKYEQLCLVFAARKDKVRQEMNKIRKFKSTIGAYRKNV